MSKIKLPKQWRYWAKKAGLQVYRAKANRAGRQQHNWFYLKGHGHVWRVNMYGHFQLGDTYEQFDRWARCDIAQVEFLPESEADFKNIVKTLHAAYHNVPDNFFQDFGALSFNRDEWNQMYG